MESRRNQYPPVTYNDDLYDVLEARIYWKSLHGYSNDSTGEPLYADAELIIEHVNRKNTKRLMVCVPITKSSTTTADSAMFFDFIMTEISRTAPSSGQQTTYTKSTFTLDKFIPNKPFFLTAVLCHGRRRMDYTITLFLIKKMQSQCRRMPMQFLQKSLNRMT